jgi:hypothetical protein
MGALAGGVKHLQVVVPEHPASGEMPRPCLPGHRVVYSQPRLLALELVGECRDGHQQLVGGGVERALTVLQVEEHAHAGRDQLLQRIRCLDGLTFEP